MPHSIVRPLARAVRLVAAALVLMLGCSSHHSAAPPMVTTTGTAPPGSAGVTDPGATPPTPAMPPMPNPITAENARPGDASWALSPAAPKHTLEGYGSRITVRPGDAVAVAVNVAKTQPVSWRVYRIGWYGGAGARLVQSGGPVTVAPQPACPRDPTTSRVECAWATAFTVPTAADALSGVYVVKLHGDAGESYVPFVIHDDRAATILVNVNVTSWQAYNDWDGESLYADASGTMPHGKAWEVSYDRPFANDEGAGRLFDYEADLILFLEGVGYDVSYTTAFDLSHDATQLDAAHVFLSAANDEYWTSAERTAVQAARDRGVNLAFFGADQALWRIRPQPSSTGVPERVLAGYKADQDLDPVLAAQGPTASTGRFRDEPLARPENGLLGVMYDGWMLVRQPLVVSDGASWVFAGTGLTTGDSLPGAVAAEYDTRFDNGVEPPGLQTLAASPVVGAHGPPRTAMATYYRAASGAEVFAIGSIGWANGLGDSRYADPRVAQITRNVLDRFAGAGHQAFPDPEGAPWTRLGATPTVIGAWSPSVTTLAKGLAVPAGVAVAADGTVFVAEDDGQTIRRIAADAAHTATVYAGTGTDGFANGPGAGARFRWPLGLALGADGTLYVADSVNNAIRAIAPDAAHTVSTYAGIASPNGGFADGAGSAAQFNDPVAVAVAPDGAVLVADLYNNRIRRIDPGAGHNVTTLAGSGAGFADGPGAAALMNSPSAIAVASDGTAYVLDTYNQAIRRIGTDASHTVTTLVGGNGYPAALVDGDGVTARLGAQSGLAWHDGRLFVADAGNGAVRVVATR
jgi:sugar lactone lactonase YvrE